MLPKEAGRSRDRQPLSQGGLRTGVHTPPAPQCPPAKPRPRAITLPHRAPECEFQAPSCSPTLGCVPKPSA